MNKINNFYCMEFTDDELKEYLIDYIIENARIDLDIKMYSQDYELINFEDEKSIETIVFDGNDENLMISFFGKQTSIFVFKEEIMFIDEDAKQYSYTSSDVYGNAVYEGKLRSLSLKEMLKIFAEIILCFIDATGVSIYEKEINDIKYGERYYYNLCEYIITVQNKHKKKQRRTFENIIIEY